LSVISKKWNFTNNLHQNIKEHQNNALFLRNDESAMLLNNFTHNTVLCFVTTILFCVLSQQQNTEASPDAKRIVICAVFGFDSKM